MWRISRISSQVNGTSRQALNNDRDSSVKWSILYTFRSRSSSKLVLKIFNEYNLLPAGRERRRPTKSSLNDVIIRGRWCSRSQRVVKLLPSLHPLLLHGVVQNLSGCVTGVWPAATHQLSPCVLI